MTLQISKTITADMMGCYVDSHHGIYAMALVQEVAQRFGWVGEYVPTDHEGVTDTRCDCRDEDPALHQELLVEATDSAEEWLNDQTDIPFMSWQWYEGDFGLYADVERVQEMIDNHEFEMVINDVMLFSDGYAVQVNDHGNMTLWTLDSIDFGKPVWECV